jgi:hypothetical protein
LLLSFAISAATLAFAGVSQGAQLIVGGTPTLSGGACVAASAWTGANGLLANTTSAGPGAACGFDFTASPGGSPSTLTQSHLPTVAGGAYTLSFYIDNASRGSGSGEIDIYFDGVQIDYFREGGVLAGRPYTFDFYNTAGASAFGDVNTLKAMPGSTGSVLSFSGTNQSGDWYIDDISLVGPRSSSAPEPAAWSLMLAGLAAVGAGARSRRASSTRPMLNPES